ncbi:MAG: dockerin type I domain-containing protein [Pirellulales bacterium]
MDSDWTNIRATVTLCIVITIGAVAPTAASPLSSGIARGQVESRTYLSYVTESLDNLIAHGTDRYGAVQSSLLVSNLDVTTKNNPLASELAAADESWRVERRERRAPGGSNFLHNQSVYQAMEKASLVTGNPAYSQFVDSNFDWALTNLKDSNNMFWWGYHRHYDVHTDTFENESGSPYHEMHFVDVPLWEEMWNRNPTAVRSEIEAIWSRHVVNKSTGQINRHDASGGLSFITSSASFIDAFAFLSSKLSGEERVLWQNRAVLLANYNWNDRNPTTNLLAHTPNETTRWDGFRSATTTPGVYVPALLRAFEYTGDITFRDQAAAYLTSWSEYAYDPASGSFWGSLALDGTPILGPWAQSGYEQFEPRGLVDLWAPEFITAQHNPDAAQAYAHAYQQFGDPEFLETAQRWASLIRKTPTTETLASTWYAGYNSAWAEHGTYAEHYGRVIDFFVTLFEETGEDQYLFSARDMAKEAVSVLWYDGLFRGHPNKPYYEAVDGVGILMQSLIDLDNHQASFEKYGDFNGDLLVDQTDFAIMTSHWLSSVAPYEAGDVTGDGFVDLADFNRFKTDYFETPSASGGRLLGAPEPSTSLFSWIVALLLVTRRQPRLTRQTR